MSKGPDEVTSTTSTEPPSFIRGPLTTAVNAAESQFLGRSGTQSPPFVGSGLPPHLQQIADSTGGGIRSHMLRAAIRNGTNTQQPPSAPQTPVSGQLGSGIIGQGQGLIGSTLQGDYLSPDSNPYLANTFNRAADLTQTRLASEFAGSGRNLDASAPARSEELQTLASNIFGGNYQAERDRQLGTLAQSQDFDPLNLFINRLAGIIPGAGGTTTATQPVYQTGIFSDRRLKTNIKRIGERNGYPWYSFEYLWGQKSEGYMSDELPSRFVGKAFGFDVVDYAAMEAQ